MLAHPTKSLSDVLNRFENLPFTCEYKYDGERAQIHRLSDGKVMVYSRNSENLSDKYPDIISRISSMDIPDVNSFVLDCEAVAWDVKQQCILPFQVLSTRKRKDVTEGSIQVQVCIFAFDLLYCNGKVLFY
jgi:DNA ligase 1